MFSKITSRVVMGLATLTPLAVPAALQAQPQVIVTAPVVHHHARYFVEFRPSPFALWQISGPYRSRSHAHDVARDLSFRGFQVVVVRR